MESFKSPLLKPLPVPPRTPRSLADTFWNREPQKQLPERPLPEQPPRVPEKAAFDFLTGTLPCINTKEDAADSSGRNLPVLDIPSTSQPAIPPKNRERESSGAGTSNLAIQRAQAPLNTSPKRQSEDSMTSSSSHYSSDSSELSNIKHGSVSAAGIAASPQNESLSSSPITNYSNSVSSTQSSPQQREKLWKRRSTSVNSDKGVTIPCLKLTQSNGFTDVQPVLDHISKALHHEPLQLFLHSRTAPRQPETVKHVEDNLQDEKERIQAPATQWADKSTRGVNDVETRDSCIGTPSRGYSSMPKDALSKSPHPLATLAHTVHPIFQDRSIVPVKPTDISNRVVSLDTTAQSNSSTKLMDNSGNSQLPWSSPADVFSTSKSSLGSRKPLPVAPRPVVSRLNISAEAPRESKPALSKAQTRSPPVNSLEGLATAPRDDRLRLPSLATPGTGEMFVRLPSGRPWPFKQDVPMHFSETKIIPPPPLTKAHLMCLTRHFELRVTDGRWHAIGCMICELMDEGSRYSCTSCGLRVCADCSEALEEIVGRDLEKMVRTFGCEARLPK